MAAESCGKDHDTAILLFIQFIIPVKWDMSNTSENIPFSEKV